MTNQTEAVLNIFRQTGAYLRGHFRLTSGLHSSEYLQSALVLQHPAHAEQFGKDLGAALQELNPGRKIDFVAAPALGGLIIGHEVARALGVRFIFTERGPDGKMVLRRGFQIEPGETGVVIEDVITTGGSLVEMMDILRQLGANIVAGGSVIDRSAGKVDIGVPRAALATLSVVAHKPDSCPLCQQGLPVVKPGSRPTPA